VVRGLLILVTFELVRYFAVNPVALWWGFRHGMAPMPDDVAARERRTGRWVLGGMKITLLAAVASFVVWTHIPIADLGLNLDGLRGSVLVGTAGGLLVVALHRLFLTLVPLPMRDPLGMEDMSEGSLTFWLLTLLLVAVAEEFWRAASLRALMRAGANPFWSVALTTVVFGVAHRGKGMARALGSTAFGAAAAYLFLWSGSLFAPGMFHLVVPVYALIWSRRVAKP
jgi:membrane protease YdiL (CAAX protease family)